MTYTAAKRIWDEAVQDTAQSWDDQFPDDDQPTDDFIDMGLLTVPDEGIGCLGWPDYRAVFRHDVRASFGAEGQVQQ